MKRIWSIAWKVALVIGIVVFVIFVSRVQQKTQIKDVSITISYEGEDTFVNEQQLQVLLDKNMGQFIGKEIKDVDPTAIEKLLHKNPYVADVSVFMSLRGNLSIKVLQQRALIRVQALNGQEFYLDQKGNSFPLNPTKSSHVLVASGKIPLKYKMKDKTVSIEELKKDSVWKNSAIVKTFDLALFIDKDEFLRSQINQIYLNNDNEFELVPKVGDQIILLGNTDNLNEKFENLVVLYKNGFSNVGWDIYKTIDLRFNNQVVCTKK